jgi:hypothetical protein
MLSLSRITIDAIYSGYSYIIERISGLHTSSLHRVAPLSSPVTQSLSCLMLSAYAVQELSIIEGKAYRVPDPAVL